MEIMLFTERSILTMLHGIVLGGGALLGLAAALFALCVMRPAHASGAAAEKPSRYLAWLTVLVAAVLWAAALSGIYIIFPPYRATPPEGVTDLSGYPKSLLQSNPDAAWLHSFAMEAKEHMPLIAAMLATAVAFIAVRYRGQLLSDALLRRLAITLLAVCFLLVAFVATLGTFINKVAPLE